MRMWNRVGKKNAKYSIYTQKKKMARIKSKIQAVIEKDSIPDPNQS